MRSPCLPQKTTIGTPCNNICYSHESRCWVSKHETLITKMGVLRETSHSYSCCPSRRPRPTYLTCLIHCCYETSRREQERCSLSQRASRSAPGSRFRKCSSLSIANLNRTRPCRSLAQSRSYVLFFTWATPKILPCPTNSCF